MIIMKRKQHQHDSHEPTAGPEAAAGPCGEGGPDAPSAVGQQDEEVQRQERLQPEVETLWKKKMMMLRCHNKRDPHKLIPTLHWH